ncbi:PQQ-dependent sugar dehydrogenase [Adhaeretor mobilis]|uniref:Soluble aldose sugar dehydrogenase YliI n=1 Tax=Adhaeretor mobilis TaxID=1930276 RepID=A0A517MPE1_9BACT|nr:PQQ-dependent sugar dehydrogenase [Adhaeretor mobilis]QDS96751.1 Soluble aldose sugar dehydrogenase YliI precursor [Adhaeretor mobilis]
MRLRWKIALAAHLACGLLALPADAQTSNPINAVVPTSPWSLQLEEVVTIPNNGSNSPRLEELVFGGVPGQAYVIEQRGEIYRFDPEAANPTPSLWLDVADFLGSDFNFNNEGGLRGLAFHPDFNNTGTPGHRKFYTTHSRDAFTPLAGTPSPNIFPSPPGVNHDSVVAEWTANANGTVDTGSYRELMRIGQPFTNHNIGRLGFNPTADSGSADYGNLYIAVGDGGSGGDPNDLAQDIDTNPSPWAHGKILRVDPIATSTEPYTIPGDNPFVGQSNRVQETWAYGLRNSHKFYWDRGTGEMYISDIGQGNIEEINRGVAGGNYGWNEREGTFVFQGSVVNTLPGDHASDPYIYPVAQYDHDPDNNGSNSSSAVVGGFVYRGTEIPELNGVYFFAEFATNENPIYAVDVDDLTDRDDFTNVSQFNEGFLAPFVDVPINDDGTLETFQDFLNGENGANYSRTDIRFGEGPDGTLYFMNKRDGTIRRVSGVVGIDPGDANRDGNVDAADLARWTAGYGTAADWNDGNFDASPLIDGLDFLTWQRGATQNIDAQAVPEPNASVLIGSLLFLAASWRVTDSTQRRRVSQESMKFSASFSL